MVSLSKSIDNYLSNYSRNLVNEFEVVNKSVKINQFKKQLRNSISQNESYKSLFLSRIITYYTQAKSLISKEVEHLFSDEKSKYKPFKHNCLSILDNGIVSRKIMI